jgi:hypothetical protein
LCSCNLFYPSSFLRSDDCCLLWFDSLSCASNYSWK